MIKKFLRLSPLLVAFGAGIALAQAPAFSTIDVDEDGVLSIAEFQTALPVVAVTDANGDGMLNQNEVEASIPSVTFADHGFQGGSGLVGEAEYDHIIEVLLEGADS
ncbi:MAG TPA: hypothetical protein VNR18_09070 [Hyphomicrobiales bacterium]|nr:hypothetical protein [Hyphomicrobiales bacterium]